MKISLLLGVEVLASHPPRTLLTLYAYFSITKNPCDSSYVKDLGGEQDEDVYLGIVAAFSRILWINRPL